MTKSKSPKSQSGPKTSGHTGPFRVAACWPHQEAPFILSMVGSEQIIIATSFTPIPFEKLLDKKISEFKDPVCDPSIAGDLPRWIFALPYETFAGDSDSEKSERPIAWSVKAALIWDKGSTEPKYVELPDAKTARFHLAREKEIKTLLTDAKKWIPPPIESIELLPTTSDDTYLDSVRSVIESIRSGMFYQVNLLRYFQSHRARGWDNLCVRMEQHSGPQGALITQGSRVLASMSPERFIEITPSDDETLIDTWPIKGTAPRISDNEKKDHESGQALLSSHKDQAELHMIIDLVRNDLTRICKPGSVEVLSPGELKKFSHVWHLEGQVRGTISPNLTLLELLKAVCPGGSITGAPKIASMARIRADEGQPRGFFMGNFFRINHDGSVQSNILIRTLVSDNWMRTARYAAGSGLVIKSIPENELDEIRSKCTTVTSVESKI